MQEYPMYSPFKLAKFFKCFIYSEEENIFKEQISKFLNFKKFKWLPEKRTSKGTYQPIPALFMNDGKVLIRTNALFEFENGDIVELKHPAFKQKYFIVAQNPQIDSILCPKWRQTYQHIELKPLVLKEPNLKE